MRLLYPFAATLLIAVTASAQSLTTTFAGGNGQAGNMFDLRAIVPINVTGFDVNLDVGTWDMEVYTLTATNTPYLPDVANPAAWTLVGSATGVVSTAMNAPTPLPIALNVPINAGEIQAFYVTVTNGTSINYTNGTTTGALFASNPHLEFFEGAGIAYPFNANFNPRVFNGNINYMVAGSGFATKSKYGAGCYESPRMVSELFAPGATVDLANTDWILSYDPATDTYTVNAGGIPYDAAGPAANGVDLVLQAPTSSSSGGTWDDSSIVQTLDPALFPAGFPYPNATGATATDITINSNGRIYLGASFDATFGGNGANSLQTPGIFAGTIGPGLPVLAAFMTDLDPDPATGGGSIWYEASSPSGGVRITWDNIPNWQDTTAGAPLAVINSMQMELLPSGLIFLSFGPSVGNGGSADNEGMVGFSAGGGEAELRVDWSTLSGFTTGNGRVAPSIDADASPVLGTTINVTVSDLPATAVFGGVIYGLTKLDPGVSLLPILGVDCNLHATLDLVILGAPTGTTFSNPFTIPNNPALTGQALVSQGLGLDASIPNALGAILSDAIELTLGT
tara:strand:- start:20474 stop:22171 length:1698 start_codon:yes stop_codon:yes gene_type:complete